jgi:eukaryotic-like serine/threonine-protein kinase
MASAAPAFPGYRVVDVLGQGGMGQVFLAEDEMLGRRVAIKTILPAVSGEGEHRARFLREARAMATVEHPRVVRVYSFGETAGQAYFVMEMIEGETLANRLRRQPQLSVDEALRIAREVAEALAAAWARGLVHRDVKPGNIILDEEGHVHVADFGLARPVEAGSDPSITREGAFVGSPHYVAPEQVRAQATDFRTDIYSLGIVLYEMLAGHRPFEGRSAIEVVSRQLTDAPPPLRSFAPETPDTVVQLVSSMTAKEPTARPPSYPTLIASLSGTLPGGGAGATESPLPTSSSMPTAAFPLAVPAPVARPPRPRWVTAAVPVVVVAALLGGYSLRDRMARTPRPPGDLVVALAPFHAADEESSKEASALAALVDSEAKRLLGDEEGRAVGLTTAPGAARSSRDARRIGERAGADVVLWGEVLAFKGDVEVQAALTPVVEGATGPRLSPLLFESQAGNPIEVRRKGAARLAEAVVRLAAQAALDRGRADTALGLLRECRPTAETLELRAAVLDKLGRRDDADAARRAAEALKS